MASLRPLLPAATAALLLLSAGPAEARGLVSAVGGAVTGTVDKTTSTVAAGLPLVTGPLTAALAPVLPVATVDASVSADATVAAGPATATASTGTTAAATTPASPGAPAAAASTAAADSAAATSASAKQGVAGVATAGLKTVTTVAGALNPPVDPACAAVPTSKPFAPWGDRASYVLAPNGGFEAGGLKSWTTTGKVATIDDNEPFFVSGSKSDDTAVSLRAGSSLSSAGFCGGLEYPTVRLFTKALKGKLAVASITMRYVGSDGLLYGLPLGVVTAGSKWKPSLISLTASGLPLLTGRRLGLTIVPIKGTLAVDDIYVDPYRRS